VQIIGRTSDARPYKLIDKPQFTGCKGSLLDTSWVILYNNGEVIAMNDIGKHIRSIRTRQGMTQDQLAEALFVTRQSISNYETGKSRPDIDMLLRIADALHTDLDSLLYGPAPEAAQQAKKKWALISGIAFGVLLVTYQLLLLLFSDVWTTLFFAPVLLLRLTLRPAMFFALGWFLLHCAGMLWKIKPLTGKPVKTIRWILVGIGAAVALLLLPILISLLVAVYQHITVGDVSVVIPPIPVYTQIVNDLLTVTMKHSYMYAFLGAACQLFNIPR